MPYLSTSALESFLGITARAMRFHVESGKWRARYEHGKLLIDSTTILNTRRGKYTPPDTQRSLYSDRLRKVAGERRDTQDIVERVRAGDV